jgi:hypothetical protein
MERRASDEHALCRRGYKVTARFLLPDDVVASCLMMRAFSRNVDICHFDICHVGISHLGGRHNVRKKGAAPTPRYLTSMLGSPSFEGVCAWRAVGRPQVIHKLILSSQYSLIHACTALGFCPAGVNAVCYTYTIFTAYHTILSMYAYIMYRAHRYSLCAILYSLCTIHHTHARCLLTVLLCTILMLSVYHILLYVPYATLYVPCSTISPPGANVVYAPSQTSFRVYVTLVTNEKHPVAGEFNLTAPREASEHSN